MVATTRRSFEDDPSRSKTRSVYFDDCAATFSKHWYSTKQGMSKSPFMRHSEPVDMRGTGGRTTWKNLLRSSPPTNSPMLYSVMLTRTCQAERLCSGNRPS